ncbi:MAG: cytochrome P450 [Gammaproteobacteria bacterium]|nr:cytochrome P450 [Gammaproteobacteria bacterium]
MSAEQARALAANFDLARLPADFCANPYPYYDALRTHDPVKRLPDGSYFLTRYEDLVRVYRDTRTFSSDKRREFLPKFGDSPLYEHHTTSLVFRDPPLHTRLRRLIGGALTPRHVAVMEPGLVSLVENLLRGLEQRESVDLIDDFAGAIPVEIIGNLLGVPHRDRAPLRDWSLAILGALEPALGAEAAERGNRAVREMLAYLETLVEDRRRTPGDPETDVLTRLIQGEGDGERLEPKDLLHNCIFLLNAGHETTTNLIGNALVLLHEWPEARRLLLRRPEAMETAVEEFLRFESSNQLGNRITTAPTAIGGVDLAPGTRIWLCIGAANRDPAKFPEPDRLDPLRTPNRHLAFGSGPHQCVGLTLGRLEARVALERFLRRFPGYTLSGAPQRGGRVRFRGFLHVPCRLGTDSRSQGPAADAAVRSTTPVTETEDP